MRGLTTQRNRLAPLLFLFGALGVVGLACPAFAGPSPRVDHYDDPLPPRAIARLGTIRLRPCHEVYFLAALPDGQRFLSIAKALPQEIGDDVITEQKVVVSLWRMATGELLHCIDLPICDPVNVALSPTGRILATAGSNRKDFVSHVFLWDLDRGLKKLGELPEVGQVYAMSFAADGKTLATAGDDGTLRLWNAETRTELSRIQRVQNVRDEMSLSRDGKILALIRGDPGKLELWDTTSGKQLHSYKLGDVWRQLKTYSSDRKLLVTTDSTLKRIQVWDVASGKEVRRIRSASEISALALSPDGQLLATGSIHDTGEIRTTNPICLWEVKTGREVRRLPGHSPHALALAFSPDGKRLISGSLYGIMHVWDVATGKDMLSFPAHEDNVQTIAFSPDGQLVATGALDGAIRLWERATGKPLRLIQRPLGQGVQRVVFTRDGRGLISSGNDEFLHFWDVATGRETRSIKVGVKGDAVWFACSPDGGTLAVCPDDRSSPSTEPGAIRLLDAATGRERRRWGDTTSCNGYLCFSPDGTKLASVSCLRGELNAVVELLDTTSGKRLRKWPIGGAIGPIAFSPDGRTLFQGEGEFDPGRQVGNRAFHAWGIPSGEDRPPSVNQLPGFGCLTVAPDGRMLAWGDTEGTITLWEVTAQRARRRWRGHPSLVTSLTFSADGKTLASGSADTTVLLWDILGRSNATSASHPGPLRLETLWDDLSSKDGDKAFDAVGQLTASPEQAVSLLKAKLRPVLPRDGRRLARLLADLDSDEFAVREKTMEQLRQFGDYAEPALRQTLKDKPTLEVRRRIEELLRGIQTSAVSLQLRDLRAAEALEYIGTPAARRLLQTMAEGVDNARLTRDAKEALKRLSKRRAGD